MMRPRTLAYRKTLLGSFKCLNCGHKTPTRWGFYTHNRRAHAVPRLTPAPVPVPAQDNGENGQKKGGVLGFLNDLPEIIEAAKKVLPKAPEKPYEREFRP